MLTNDKKSLCSRCFKPVKQYENFCEDCRGKLNNSTHTAALKEGTVLLGKYAVGKLLGKGGFGMTYLCYDLVNDKSVAIKEFFPESLAYRTAGQTTLSTQSAEKLQQFTISAKKFYEEASLVSRFNGNPNVISVHEFFYENNTAYFVMEYLDGFDLKHYITQKGKKIPESEAVYITDKVLDALLIVHSMGVLHRDISPDNIYMCSDGNVKLIDFGAARQVVGEESKSLSVILKQGFAPLEQYQKRGNQGPWTDIYALGATLYYAITGIVIDDAMSRLDDPSLKLDGISPALAQVLTKMLAVRVEDRYKSVVELKADMAQLQLAMTEPSIRVTDKHSFCIYCGKKMPFGIEICRDCEAKENAITVNDIPLVGIPVSEKPVKNVVKKPKKWLLPTLIAAASVVAFVLVVLIIIGLLPEDRNSTPVDPAPDNPDTSIINVEIISGKCGDNLTWELNGIGILTISGKGKMYHYELADDHFTMPWAEYSSDIMKVVVNEGVTEIGDYAFIGFDNLTEIQLPSTLKIIGDLSIASCNKIETIKLPMQLEYIGFSAFSQNLKMKSIEIPASVSLVGGWAFDSWTSEQTIIVNETKAYVDENWDVEWNDQCNAKIVYADSAENENAITGYCGDNMEWKLTSDGVLTISGSGKMYDYYIDADNNITVPWCEYADKINKIVINDGVEYIGMLAFAGSNVKEIKLPSTVWGLGAWSLAMCNELENVVIPAETISLGNTVFYGDTKIKTLEIPETMVWIGTKAFIDWTAEQTIIVNATKAYTDEFWDPEWAAECNANIKYSKGKTTQYSEQKTAHTHSWGEEQYESRHPHLGYLTCTTCHANVYVGNAANLPECTICNPSSSYSNSNIVASGACGDNITWTLDDMETLTLTGTGATYNYSYTEDDRAPWYDYADSIKYIVVGEGITLVGSWAFYHCENVVSVSLPDSLVTIESFAFDSCKSLQSINIPSSVTKIGAFAFYWDKALSSITIPASVEYVGTHAFDGFTSKQTIYIEASKAYVEANWSSDWNYGCYAKIIYDA